MEADEHAARARSFSHVASSYDAHRPDYPVEAARWLAGDPPARVLELGAGTGKLTAVLGAIGHDVVATDPSAQMLDACGTAAPKARRVVAAAEAIPLPSSSVDVAVAGQAYHWFDVERALPEIARVLAPGGTLAVVWNTADLRVPWVQKVFRLIDHQGGDEGADPFAGSDVFTLADQADFKHWQPFRRETLVGFVASSSYAATRDSREREQLLAAAGALYDSYDRGPDGLLMPWVARCFRARVAGLRPASPPPPRPSDPEDETVVISFP